MLGGGFNAYDYGEKENLKRYGTEKPLAYDLKLVTAPVYIFWSRKDRYATEKVSILFHSCFNKNNLIDSNSYRTFNGSKRIWETLKIVLR